VTAAPLLAFRAWSAGNARGHYGAMTRQKPLVCDVRVNDLLRSDSMQVALIWLKPVGKPRETGRS
jgi:hypothetical protein